MTRELPTNLTFSIPLEVMQDRRLTLTSRVVFSEILAMSIKYGYCFAPNSHFTELLGISDRSMTNAINQLELVGYIEVTNKQSRHRRIVPTQFLESLRKIYGVGKSYSAKSAPLLRKNCGPTPQNLPQNQIARNYIDTNKNTNREVVNDTVENSRKQLSHHEAHAARMKRLAADKGWP